MSSSENPEVSVTERGGGSKDKDKHGEEDGGDKNFIDKVKDFIHDIGEKIEGAVGFGKPSADVSGIHIPHISLHRADLVVDVLIKNPNPVPIPLVDIDYLIDSDGRKLVSGLIPDAGTIHAHGEETVKIPVSLVFDDIRSTYKDIQPGTIIPYLVRVVLLVDVPIIGRIKIPLEKDGEIPVPYKPDVDVEKIKFHHFSFDETTATLHVKLENKNDFDLGLNLFQYEMWLGDDSIASAELTQSAKIEKQGITRMQIPFSFRPKDFGSAVWDMIRGRGTGYTIKGQIDVDTPWGNMKLPISKEGGTTRIKKDEDGDDDDDDNYGHETNTTASAPLPPLSPLTPCIAATHGTAPLFRIRLHGALHAPPSPAPGGAAPPLLPRPRQRPRARGLRRLCDVLLRRVGVVRGGRRGGGRRGGVGAGVRRGAGARRRRRARDVGRGGGAGAGGAGDAALPARAAPVRDHGGAPPRHVRGGAPRPRPALRGAAGGRRRHVRGGVQPWGDPAGVQHQEEEQPHRAALHLLRRHLPPRHLLHQARLPGHAAAEAQRRRRRHPLHQLQDPQAQALLARRLFFFFVFLG